MRLGVILVACAFGGLLLACERGPGESACTDPVEAQVLTSPLRVTWSNWRCTVGSVWIAEIDSLGGFKANVASAFSDANRLRSGVLLTLSPGSSGGLAAGHRYRLSVGVVVGGDGVFTVANSKFTFWPPD